MIGCFVRLQAVGEAMDFLCSISPMAVFAVEAERPANGGFPQDPMGRDYKIMSYWKTRCTPQPLTTTTTTTPLFPF